MKAKRKRWQAGLHGCVEEGMHAWGHREGQSRVRTVSRDLVLLCFFFFFSLMRCHKLCGQSRWVGSWVLGKAISQGVSSRGSHSMACLRSFRGPRAGRPIGQEAV